MLTSGQNKTCFLIPALFLCIAFILFPHTAYSSECVRSYDLAAERYYHLKNNNQLTPKNCASLMDEFAAVHDRFPDCHKADDSLYMVGALGLKAYKDSKKEEVLLTAVHAFEVLARDYPESSLSDDALYLAGEAYLASGKTEKARELLSRVAESPSGDMAKKARERLAALPRPLQKPETEHTSNAGGGTGTEEKAPPSVTASPPLDSPEEVAKKFGIGSLEEEAHSPPAPYTPDKVEHKDGADNSAAVPGARLLSLRHWSNKDYTRVVIDLDREVPYLPPHLLRPDPELKTPPRLYIDFQDTAISSEFRQTNDFEAGCYALPIGDGLLKKARAAQYRPDVARVVLDIERIDHYKAFPLPGKPFRYVIDVYGDPKTAPPVARAEGGKNEQSRQAKTSPRSSKKIIVVLDPGHGGKDPGAVGRSSKEKDITLDIARRTERVLEARRPDIEVVLTRTDDRYLGLVDRTARANTMNADLFVSIHVNAAANSSARGVETYYLDNTTDRAALKLAAKENFVEEKVLVESRDTTNLILADLITSSKVADSVPLAESIQKELVAGLTRKWRDTSDKGVKKAPFWVLTGATMPCVLVETGFISNSTEEKRLSSASYRQTTAESIALGITSYLDSYESLVMAE